MDQGAPDSDEVVTLEQLAAGEAGPEEAGYAKVLLDKMQPADPLPPLLTEDSTGSDMRVGKRASKRQRQVQNQESKQARAAGAVAEAAKKRPGRAPKKAALPSQAVEANAKRARTGPRDREKELGSSDLPSGWQLFIKTQRTGANKGKPHKEIFSPEGQRYLSHAAARQAWEADGHSPGTPAPGMPGSILQFTLSVADPPPGWDVLLQLPGERGGRSSVCWQSKSNRHQKRCWGQVHTTIQKTHEESEPLTPLVSEGESEEEGLGLQISSKELHGWVQEAAATASRLENRPSRQMRSALLQLRNALLSPPPDGNEA
ncbi:hypothetical protein WJX74_010876 [Apatococcus lobatus]|uniref:Uncharacterized protein n=2 Tax=Apatococcus TaxID=904362 RepID=A0AAW1T4L0_9CHLO